MILEGMDYTSEGWGVAIFIQQGFAAWINAWSKIEKTIKLPAYIKADDEPIVLPNGVLGNVVMTIAGMILGKLREEAA